MCEWLKKKSIVFDLVFFYVCFSRLELYYVFAPYAYSLITIIMNMIELHFNCMKE